MRNPLIDFKLGQVLAEKGLSQYRAAKMCGCSRQYIQQLVADPPTRFDEKMLSMLCGGLGVGVDALLEFKAGERPPKRRQQKADP